MKTPVQVTILGQVFTLRSNTSSEEALRVAEYVSKAVDEVVATGKAVDSLNVSLLALMNVAQAYLQLRDQRENEQAAVVRIDRLTQRLDKVLRQSDGKDSGSMSLYGDFK